MYSICDIITVSVSEGAEIKSNKMVYYLSVTLQLFEIKNKTILNVQVCVCKWLSVQS